MRSNRRRFFQAAGTGAAGMAIGGSSIASAAVGSDKAGTEEDGPVLQIGDDIAVADTQHGKVRGYVLRGIHYFLGIPYGADTSGANRFMPPQKPKPWTDVRPAIWWGNTAPQNMDNRYANQYASFRDHWNYDDVSEDCLKLNVFTPGDQGRQEAAGAVLDPRRRLLQRQRHRARRVQRRELRPARRRRLLLHQPPPGPARLLQPGRRGRGEVRGIRQRRHARHRGSRSSGSATTSRASAAIRAT